jgi:hypothetical protein
VAASLVAGTLMGMSLSPGAAAAPAAVDAAFARFWSARDLRSASAAAGAVVKSGVSFEDALARLRAGRTYSADVPRGVVRLTHTIDGTEFPYTIEVPQSYNPATKYQVRVQLHGGVGRPDAAPRNGIGQLAGAEQIYVMPTAWSAAEWWTGPQLQNLRAIFDSLKRTYNVDENRVVLSGVSDGGTACYYFAMRETTPFAAFLPLNGALAILRNPSLRRDGELFPNNFLDKPFFIVNGARDPLYPTSLVEPYIEHMIAGGVEVKYLPQAEGVHNTAWWPEVKDSFEAFVASHPRQPYPAKLTWETDLTAATNRAHWLVIDALARPGQAQAGIPDLNQFNTGLMPDFGLRVQGARVTSIGENSNASVFGFQPGDVIVSVNGTPLASDGNALEALNRFQPGTVMKISVSRANQPVELTGVLIVKGEPRVTPLFRHAAPTGRVDLVRDGNIVRATTRGVERFTVLLSPDAFDFSKPLTVIADGRTVFNGRVSASVATLMKWAARDNDRTMLFGAELQVTLPQ